MLIFIVIFLIFACTFVGFNQRISDGSKSIFFLVIAGITAVCLLLGFLLS